MAEVVDRLSTRRASAANAVTRVGAFYAGCLLFAGLFFVLYPAIRPFSSETGYAGARAFASSSWVAAHSLGIVAFILLALGVFGTHERLRDTTVANRTAVVVSTVWLGVGLTIPYYGAEVFGLHSSGQQVLDHHQPALLKPLIHGIRWEAGIWFIITGLLLLAVGSVLLAVVVWRSGLRPRWAAIPLAAGLVLYIPQFTGSQPIRVAHGLLMLAGCWMLAIPLARTPRRRPSSTGSARRVGSGR